MNKLDCIIIDDDDMSRTTLTQLIGQVNYLNLVNTFTNPMEAMETLRGKKVDLIFLDIEMPGMTGMDMLKNLDIKTNVILITSHKEYAIEAYEYNVIDYLVKPITLPRFLKAVGRIKNSEDSIMVGTDKNEHGYFFIKKDSVLNKVPAKDILWIEALGDYVTVHTASKKYVLHLTLKGIESKLPVDKFVRVHRSYIVRMDNIRQVEDTSIFITDVPIPIGSIYKENFLNKLNLLA